MKHPYLVVGLLVGATVASTTIAAKKTTKPSKAPAAVVGAAPRVFAKSGDPCTDFYEAVCSDWMKANPVPPDQSHWGRFEVLRQDNLVMLRRILEDGAKTTKKRDPDKQKIGDYYATCMDEQTIDKKGIEPLAANLARIAALTEKAQLPALLAELHADGSNALFDFGATPDMKNSGMYVAEVDQNGLGLPERDYYTRTDPKSVELRAKYVAHIAGMFELAGDPPEIAAPKAKVVLDIETALAAGSLDLVSRRDPVKVYHKMSVPELQALTPSFDWTRYFAAAHAAPSFASINVAVPDFFKAMDTVLTASSFDDLKTYLTWHELHEAAPLLSRPFVDRNFEFYGKTLTGAKELRPRWKRCVQFTDGALGEALGRAYVEKAFGPKAKERVLNIVAAIEGALERDIKQLDWMGTTTKMEALGKLAAVRNKVGYPNKWRDYSALAIKKGDALGNAQRALEFEHNRWLKKIDTPVDPDEWQMTPPTINAYYNPLENDINFPAGILQPPFYDPKADDAANLGAIGAIIGHELTHGFDDEGRQFDAKGNLRDWWSAEDGQHFDDRASCLANEYSSFVAVDDIKLNGKLTLGENTADNGGLRLAYMALTDMIAGRADVASEGSPEQRFFLGWARAWCENDTPELARMWAQIDTHSPSRYRVNGTVANMPEFAVAFRCKPGAPMVREPQCRVW